MNFPKMDTDTKFIIYLFLILVIPAIIFMNYIIFYHYDPTIGIKSSGFEEKCYLSDGKIVVYKFNCNFYILGGGFIPNIDEFIRCGAYCKTKDDKYIYFESPIKEGL